LETLIKFVYTTSPMIYQTFREDIESSARGILKHLNVHNTSKWRVRNMVPIVFHNAHSHHELLRMVWRKNCFSSLAW